jgi:hypothetical protein
MWLVKITVKNQDYEIETTIIDRYPIQSFLVNVVKPGVEKDNKRDTFTVWENAHT